MRVKQIIGVSACTLMLIGALDVKAAEDAYVDLSVLNDLQPGDSLFVETQPLFPIVKKDTPSVSKTKKAKKKPAVKQDKKKPQSKSAKKEEAKKAEVKEKKIDILPQTPEIPQPLADAKKSADVVTKPEVVQPQDAKEATQKANVQVPTQAESQKVLSTSEMKIKFAEEVSKQTVTDAPKQPASVDAPKAVETTAEKVSTQDVSTVQPQADKSVPTAAEVKAEASTQAPTQAQASAQTQAPSSVAAPQANNLPATSQSTNESALSQEKADKEVVKPLIPQDIATQTAPSAEEIRFAEGSYEISEENAQKILALINTFENPKQNKIAIYAYNYDNGENSFKKKKLSLDRATEIRSLLLNQGYKNFSIKVINVTDSPSKSNLVEIEEIK